MVNGITQFTRVENDLTDQLFLNEPLEEDFPGMRIKHRTARLRMFP